MTKNEKAVRAVHPDATIERQRTHGGEVYYLVRAFHNAYMYLADGETKAQAWKKAAEEVARAAEATPTEPTHG